MQKITMTKEETKNFMKNIGNYLNVDRLFSEVSKRDTETMVYISYLKYTY